MYRYFDNNDAPKDKYYQKIMEEINIFMEHLPSEGNKQLLSNMVSKCYHKHCEAIKSMEGDDPSLMTSFIMALLVDQQLVIDRLKDNKC